jgi:DNA-binding NtrC family response regulator
VRWLRAKVVTTDWVLRNEENPLPFQYLNSSDRPDEPGTALLGIASDIEAAVAAARQGQGVYLRHPYRMARTLKSLFKALNRDVQTRRCRSVTQPAEPERAIANSRTLKVVTASCSNQTRPDQAKQKEF